MASLSSKFISHQPYGWVLSATAVALGAVVVACAAGSDGSESDSEGALTDIDAEAPSVLDCGDAGGGAPARLQCTGLYADFAAKTLAPNVEPYAPAFALWSDGAEKQRWIQLPVGEKIDTSNMDEWVFPVGTKLWKQFVVNGQRIETRFLWKTAPSTWVRTTYRWNAAEDDAVRLDTGEWAGDAGNPSAAEYEIPSVQKCDRCHAGRKDKVLGFEAVNLGAGAADRGGITLSTLVQRNQLTVNPPATSLAIPEDATGKAAPALGWLHSNCGITCHNTSPRAACRFMGMNLRLSASELLPPDGAVANVADLAAFKTTVGVVATIPDETFKRITPGDPSRSATHFLASHRDATNPDGQMPPIVSHKIDPAGTTLLADWISSLH